MISWVSETAMSQASTTSSVLRRSAIGDWPADHPPRPGADDHSQPDIEWPCLIVFLASAYIPVGTRSPTPEAATIMTKFLRISSALVAAKGARRLGPEESLSTHRYEVVLVRPSTRSRGCQPQQARTAQDRASSRSELTIGPAPDPAPLVTVVY